jgi:thiamine-phosphate pyrophosphorylase
MMLPRLHVVTDDALLAAPDFLPRAGALLAAGGEQVALHLRARTLATRALHDLAVPLAAAALRTGARLLVNDRVDVALAVRSGAHLGRRGIPLPEARRLLDRALLGFSAHAVEEARVAEAEGADYLFLGTIFPSASHPEGGAAGLPLLQRAVAGAAVPVLAIGGITVERARGVRAAGGYGVAVIRGIWEADDAPDALRAYLEALGS